MHSLVHAFSQTAFSLGVIPPLSRFQDQSDATVVAEGQKVRGAWATAARAFYPLMMPSSSSSFMMPRLLLLLLLLLREGSRRQCRRPGNSHRRHSDNPWHSSNAPVFSLSPSLIGALPPSNSRGRDPGTTGPHDVLPPPVHDHPRVCISRVLVVSYPP